MTKLLSQTRSDEVKRGRVHELFWRILKDTIVQNATLLRNDSHRSSKPRTSLE